MKASLKESDINHLRRLVAWVRCEIGQTEQELIAQYCEIAKILPHELSDDSKQRIVKSIEDARNVPQYIRRAVKALEKVVGKIDGDIVDAEASRDKALPSQELMKSLKILEGKE